MTDPIKPLPPDPRDTPDAREAVLTAPPPVGAELYFIGVLRTPFTHRDMCPRQGDPEDGPLCRVVLDPRFVPALQGIETHRRIEVLYWLHGGRRDLLTQGRKWEHHGERATGTRGTFTLRSPMRPNPIGISQVSLVACAGAELMVRGLDCLDGTPLLDIKPVLCGFGGAA